MKKTIVKFFSLLCILVLALGISAAYGEITAEKNGLSVDDCVIFGNYPQGANGEVEPIEWLVLDVQDNKALLISRYGLDCQQYNTSRASVTWETCTLRTWLNSTFISKAFTSAQQEDILTTTVDNSKSQCFDFTAVSSFAEKTVGGNDTQDKIFLLSYAEANKYFNVQYSGIEGALENVKSRVEPTAYAIAQGALTSSSKNTADGKEAGWWWLRSPGLYQHRAAYVYTDGALGHYGVNFVSVVVRPALWIDISAEYTIASEIELTATSTTIPTATPAATPAAISTLIGLPNVGDHITFGVYPQTSEGTDSTPIEWIVLDVQDGKVLLISRYGLDTKPYNTERVDITWEECSLRTWLNSEFLNIAFSTDEQDAILITDVDNSSGQCYSGWSTSGGNNTQDKIFLLSYAEANKYFNVQHYSIYGAENNIKSRVAPTAYAIAQGAYTSRSYNTDDDEATGWWWLRSPGFEQYIAADVFTCGFLRTVNVDYAHDVVRPALWLNLESDVF